MKTVFKYKLEVTDHQEIELPKEASVLLIAEQHDVLCMWCEVDTEEVKETRCFRIYGTGHEIQNRDNLMFLQTVVMSGGHFVAHIFEEESRG